ncbi:hypothetical protein LFZ92_08705 [Salmonella enterica subsp. salamae serovar 57:z29:z42]|uniref:O-antigen flippase n=2 Tax=Salmonella enterica TaxID=28901 RepID=U3GL84_SALER|nr:O-antigen flippase [Salmonella enterica]ASO10005.1 hypothetical protein LFZ92_08705 [Salmonella enterica subsp. salamae serovar 57:z29:z42]
MLATTVFRSVKYGIVFSIIIMILTFFVRKFFIESFGTELTGFYLLMNQLIGYLNLAELGLTTASIYLFFKPINSGSENEIILFFYVIKKIYKVIAFSILILGIFIAALLPILVTDDINWYNIYIPWVIFVISTALSYLYSAETVLLTASEKLYIVKIISGISRTACFLIQILILKNDGSFILFCTIEILYVGIQYYLFRNYVSKLHGKSIYKKVKDKSLINDIKKNITNEIKKTFVHKMSGVLIFNTDYIIISLFIGLSTITIYSSYLMFIQAVAIILSTIVAPLGASIGNYLHRTNIHVAYRKFNIINIGFFALATVACVIYNNSSTNLVQMWMGNSVMFPSDVVILLAINLFCLIARSAVDVFKVAFGYMSDIHLPLIEGFANLLFSLILVNFYGVKGVIYGTIFSNIAIIMMARPLYLYIYAFKLGAKKFVKDHYRLWIITILFLLIIYKGYDKCLYILINKIAFTQWDINNTLVHFLINQFIFLIVTSIVTSFVYLLFFPKLFLVIISFLRKKYE